MKKVLFCFSMPHDTYFGGVASILKSYLSNNELFENYGYEIGLFDYFSERLYKIKKWKIYFHVLAILQRNALLRCLRGDRETIVHIHTSCGWLLLKDLFLARAIKRKRKNKVGMTIHFCELDKILYRKPWIRKLELKIMKKYVDFLVILSKQTMKEFEDAGIPSNKLHLLYTFHSFTVPQIPCKSSEIPNLLFVGSFDRRKGLSDLLTALHGITLPYQVNICGGYTDLSIKETIEAKLLELKDKAVNCGYVSGKQKESVFAQSDILILPSYGEGLPIVIMEALAMGCVIITTNVGAIPEIIKAENGILIEPGNISMLKTSIEKYLKNNELLRKTQEYNYEYGKRFSEKENIKSLCQIYNNI